MGAVVNLLDDRALSAARLADRVRLAGRARGPLHGVPYGVKDLISARGAPTTWGLPPYRDRVIDHDAAVVSALEWAGAILVAKLATDELAGGLGAEHADATLTGPCRNPHDPEAFAGSSSGGPAAVVGAGILPFAIGTETLGSILEPAAFCGVSGLRPTAGRVDADGVMPVAPSLDRVGPLAASPADCAAVLRAIATPPEPQSKPIQTIGIPSDALETVEAGVAAAFTSAVTCLEGLGLTVRPIRPLQLPAAEAAFLMLMGEFTGNHRDFLLSPLIDELASAENRRNAAAWLALPADAYVLARRVAARCTSEVLDALKDVDALAYPAHPTVAPPIDADFAQWLGDRRTHRLRAAGPIAGLPAVVVTTGMAERALPTGICLVGSRNVDEALLALADGLRTAHEAQAAVHPAS